MQHTPEIQANIDYINDLYERGIDQMIKNAVPYPNKLVYCWGKSKLIAITKNAILISTNEVKRKERQERDRQFREFLYPNR